MRGYVASGSISFLRNVDSLRSDAAEQERRLDELSAGDSDLRAKLVEVKTEAAKIRVDDDEITSENASNHAQAAADIATKGRLTHPLGVNASQRR